MCGEGEVATLVVQSSYGGKVTLLVLAVMWRKVVILLITSVTCHADGSFT